jgi:hypothetical protein
MIHGFSFDNYRQSIGKLPAGQKKPVGALTHHGNFPCFKEKTFYRKSVVALWANPHHFEKRPGKARPQNSEYN